MFAHERTQFDQEFPVGHEYRKYWEVAMAVRALAACGALRPTAELLGVAAGNEPTVFYLTNLVRRVFVTDLYLESILKPPLRPSTLLSLKGLKEVLKRVLSRQWQESANPGMMLHPERYWPSEWRPRRLVVQHMNALDLLYDDNSFDGVFSSSSIEHFGTLDAVRQSLREMARVLKPGGVLTLSTEFRLSGDAPGLPGTLMFDETQVRELFLEAAEWETVSAPDFQVSDATLRTELPLDDASRDLQRHIRSRGEIIFHELTWSNYPHIVLRKNHYLWTSIHIALRKRRDNK